MADQTARGFKYLIPNVTIAPPLGFAVTDVYPIHHLRRAMQSGDGRVHLSWSLVQDGAVREERAVALDFVDGECRNPQDAVFRYEERERADWLGGESVGYLETRVWLEDESWFRRRNILQNYTVYSSPERKTFVSPQAFKFSNPQVVEQIRAYGQWVEGYPACRVDPERDIDLSLVLINAYERPTLVTLQAPDLNYSRRIRTPALTAVRVSLGDCLSGQPTPWTGQIYVSGPNRTPCFMIHHSRRDPLEIGKLEHLDPYRGETAWTSFSRAIHEHRVLRNV